MYRNDEITLAAIERLAPERIVISPGPCTPNEAGVSMDVIRTFGPHIPLLGICLGHQSLGQVFGGEVVRARQVMHGKLSAIHHTGSGVFRGLPSPYQATRYHSLVVRRDTLPDCLEARFGATVVVRHQSEIRGGGGVRLGCEWEDLDAAGQRSLRRYIEMMQRRRRLLSLS